MKNSWPQYTREEIIAVSNVLSSAKVNYLFGEMGKKFEREFAEFTGTKYSLALANGTLALDIALRAIQISKGDEVIVTPRSFIASVSCINLLGAKPVFVDIEKNSQNISPDQIAQAITKKTKAIICVHLAGMPCEMAHIMNIAKKHNLLVIEDAAQALGSRIDNQMAGTFGDFGIFSFHSHKNISTLGEGGMLVVKNKEVASIIPMLRHNGHRAFDYEREYYWSPAMDNVDLPELHDKPILPNNFCLGEVECAVGVKLLDRIDIINNENILGSIIISSEDLSDNKKEVLIENKNSEESVAILSPEDEFQRALQEDGSASSTFITPKAYYPGT